MDGAAAGSMPAQPPQGGAPEGEETSTAVTITKQPDGSYMVAPEAPDESMAQETPGMESQEASAGKPAATIDEALSLARSMLEGGDDQMSVEQAFSGGFNGE